MDLKSKLKIAWNNMKQRCYNQNNPSYKDYGGRGIKICNDWYYDFNKFYEWAVNNGFASGLTIDKMDNDGNYEPSNCRWISAKEQFYNRRSSRFIEYKGETLTAAQWAERFGMPNSVLLGRLNGGWSMEKIEANPNYEARFKGSKSSRNLLDVLF